MPELVGVPGIECEYSGHECNAYPGGLGVDITPSLGNVDARRSSLC